MRLLAGLAVIGGILLAGSGFFLASEATMGVAMIGLACFFGIVARMLQASDHHAHLVATIKAGRQTAPAAPASKDPAAAEGWIAAGAQR